MSVWPGDWTLCRGDGLSPRPGNLAGWAQARSGPAGDAERPGAEPGGLGVPERWGGRAGAGIQLQGARSRKEQVSAV